MVEKALTDEQIHSILDDIPLPPGTGKTARQQARRNMLYLIEEQLRQVKIVDHPQAFQEFKEEIVDGYYRSLIASGDPVGVLAATSCGSQLTQFSLNTHRSAGAVSGTAMSFSKVRDLLTGSKSQRNASMQIYLKDQGETLHTTTHIGTEDMIYAMRKYLEENTILDVLAQEPEILNHQQALAEGVDDMIALHSLLRPARFVNAASRYPFTYVMMLTLDTYRMYSHRITMLDVAKAIEGPIEPADIITCVWVSQTHGRMYILIDETRDLGMNIIQQQSAMLIFYQNYLTKVITDFLVKGIKGIRQIEPVQVKVLETIRNIVPRDGDLQRIYISQRRTRLGGASVYDLQRLIQLLDIPIVEVNLEDLYIDVRFTGDLIKHLEDTSLKDERPEVDQAYRFFYIKTQGSNYEEIIWRSDIDPYRTFPYNAHDIVSIVGISATRTFLIMEFINTLRNFSEDTYIDPRHPGILYDLLTNLGSVNGLGYAGLNRRRVGPMAAASHERASDVIITAAMFGEVEKSTGVSTNISIGRVSQRLGTGGVRVEVDYNAMAKQNPTHPTADGETLPGYYDDEIINPGSGFDDILATVPEEVHDEDTLLAAVQKQTRPTLPAPTINPATLPPGATLLMAGQAPLPKVAPVTAVDITTLTDEQLTEIVIQQPVAQPKEITISQQPIPIIRKPPVLAIPVRPHLKVDIRTLVPEIQPTTLGLPTINLTVTAPVAAPVAAPVVSPVAAPVAAPVVSPVVTPVVTPGEELPPKVTQVEDFNIKDLTQQLMAFNFRQA